MQFTRKHQAILEELPNVKSYIDEVIVQETDTHRYEILQSENMTLARAGVCYLLNETDKLTDKSRNIIAMVPYFYDEDSGLFTADIQHQNSNPIFNNVQLSIIEDASRPINTNEQMFHAAIKENLKNTLSFKAGDVFYFHNGISYGYGKSAPSKNTHFVAIKKSGSTKQNILLDTFDSDLPLSKRDYYRAHRILVPEVSANDIDNISLVSKELSEIEQYPRPIAARTAIERDIKNPNKCLCFLTDKATGRPLAKTFDAKVKDKFHTFAQRITYQCFSNALARIPLVDDTVKMSSLPDEVHELEHYNDYVYVFKKTDENTNTSYAVLGTEDERLIAKAISQAAEVHLKVFAEQHNNKIRMKKNPDFVAKEIIWPLSLAQLTQEQVIALDLADEETSIVKHEQAIKHAIASGEIVDQKIIAQYPLMTKPYQLLAHEFINAYPDIVKRLVEQAIDELLDKGKKLVAQMQLARSNQSNTYPFLAESLKIKEKIKLFEEIEITDDCPYLTRFVEKHLHDILPLADKEFGTVQSIKAVPAVQDEDNMEDATETSKLLSDEALKMPGEVPTFRYTI